MVSYHIVALKTHYQILHTILVPRLNNTTTFLRSDPVQWLTKGFQAFPSSTKTECDYLYGWIKTQSHTQKSHPKMVNPREIAGKAEEGAFPLLSLGGELRRPISTACVPVIAYL